MVSQKLMTIVLAGLALLFSPVILGIAGLLFAILTIMLCPGVTAKVSGCPDCYSPVCPTLLLLILFVGLPLGIISICLKRRRSHL